MQSGCARKKNKHAKTKEVREEAGGSARCETYPREPVRRLFFSLKAVSKACADDKHQLGLWRGLWRSFEGVGHMREAAGVAVMGFWRRWCSGG